MTFRTILALAPVTAALAFAPLAPAMAQDSTATPDTGAKTEMQAQDQATADYSDEMLDSFVDAAIDVAALRQSYAQKLNAADDDSQRQALVKEANDKMRQAIEATDGITVDEYIEIGEASSADAALNERITAMLREKLPQSGQGAADQKSDG